ncbi:fructuronate reductase [Mesocricetibacter intestinalis]|uniref:Fructuronate reductase n=1 Tax=Mesocricetibacter intestinalis TaxID=1521930 RepID=A0A4R6VA86_9PAST|nr:mannitol dehydrogenase family protein [Mesocricetibacter intestinalis]TDQ56854.1 fructuronate reductase [Mesocricetibacter intestinalis]
MQLSYDALSLSEWREKGYQLPLFNIPEVVNKTKEEPVWLHLGAGNIFRAFLANLQQRLLDQGYVQQGIIVAEGFDYEIIEKAYRPFDNLSIFAKLKNDHSLDKIVIASIVESLRMDPSFKQDFARLKEIFISPSLQMVSLTITEKGYQIKGLNGEYYPAVQSDLEQGLANPQSYIGKIVALLHERFVAGASPLAVVSMDNMSKNGEKLHNVIVEFARQWEKCGHVSQGFLDYLDSDKISFPWSMIDKITPRPDEEVQQRLQEDGIDNLAPVVTAKNTYVAPFVNAEELEYLAVEDNFPNGRPPLEKVGVIFADRNTVNKIETMKVTTCLNPLHTGLAIFGCLLGFNKISTEVRDPDLLALIKKLGYQEGLPVVIDPILINPKQFLDEVINIRLSNDFIPDSPQRIATDTSQKLAIRFGETIKSYVKSGKPTQDLVAIPLILAGWLRYLLGIDDQGNKFENSPDPRLAELKAKLAHINLGTVVSSADLEPILSDKSIFGVDLYAVGLGTKVEQYFNQLLAGVGAVRTSLRNHVN